MAGSELLPDERVSPQEAGEQYRALFEQAAVGVALLDTRTGRFLRVNRKYTEIIGYSKEELATMDFMQITHPDDLAPDLGQMARLERREIREFSLEKRLIHRDGGPLWVALTVSALADDEPPRQHIAIVQDISARKAAEHASRTARAELEATLSALPDLLFDVDDEGRIHDFRTRDVTTLAMPPSEFLGRKLADVLPPDIATIIQAALDEALVQGRSSGRSYRLMVGGVERSYELSVAPKPVEAGRPRLIAIVRDITERVVLAEERLAIEAQLRQSQKMEAVGTLAGGIAHDFNNLIAIISVNLELLQGSVPPSGREPLESIGLATTRAATLVKQILAFSRKQSARREVGSLGAIVEDATRLLRATIPRGVRVDVDIDPTPVFVRADASQLQQVVINLGTNAWQAIASGSGTIAFRVDRVGDHARLRVTDDGIGVPAELAERIFEPFFTTKAAGSGSGLGLSVVHRIIEDHGGTILIESNPGQGTTFEVRLEAVAGAPQVVASEPVVVTGNGAHVMVIDDETLLLRPLVRALVGFGYRATGFNNPVEALAAFRDTPLGFDVVMTDLNMPELSGLDVAKAVRELRPEIPIILISGYAPHGDAEIAEAGIGHRIAKPFDLPALSQLLRSVVP
jgi:PAS domain S-box-containing protein